MSEESRATLAALAAKVGGFLRWLAGAAVGLAGLAVVCTMLVLCYRVVTTPPIGELSRLDAFAIAYALAFVSVVVGIACVRLIVPVLRTPGGGILGAWSGRVLGSIYGLILVGGVILNVKDAIIPVTVIVLGFLVILALRSTFGWPKDGSHGRTEDQEGE